LITPQGLLCSITQPRRNVAGALFDAPSATGPFGWVLERPRVLRFKPWRGQLGLFDTPEL
jgi:hypothetical protein